MSNSDAVAAGLRADAAFPFGRIIVAGIPRSGTTLMFRALAGLPPGSTTPASDLNGVVKTHSFEPRNFEGAACALFLFGNPILSVISTKRKRYDQNHFRNCGAGDLDPETTDIFVGDHLNYERMWDAWTSRQGFPVIAIRYERLHDSIRYVENMLSRSIPLPPLKPREADISQVRPEELDLIRKTYATLQAKIDKAPDVSIFL
jgi:hypothetical protein